MHSRQNERNNNETQKNKFDPRFNGERDFWRTKPKTYCQSQQNGKQYSGYGKSIKICS